MTQPLQGCSIALSGNFKQTHAKLAASITENGGIHYTKVNEDCTHLVASQKDFEGSKTKVKQAQDIGKIHIVEYDWLVDSLEQCTKLDERSYLMGKPTLQPRSNSKAKGASQKKAQIDSSANQGGEDCTAIDEPPAKRQKDGQKARSTSTFVPLDDCVVQQLGTSYRVYIAQDGTIYDALLNMTDTANNNNKFYRLQLLVSTSGVYKTWTRWARIGDIGQTKVLGSGDLESALAEFQKKFKDKSGLTWNDRLDPPKSKKYTFLERNYEDGDEPDSNDDSGEDAEGDEDDGVSAAMVSKNGKRKDADSFTALESQLSKPVQHLMEMIFNYHYFAKTMEEMSYDAEKLPLKDLSKRVLERGFQLLKDIADLLYNPSLANETHNIAYGDTIETLSNAYYSTIPHNFGRMRAPIISTEGRLLQEVKLLESLSDMEIAGKIMQNSDRAEGGVHTLDRQFAGLNLEEMTPLTADTNEYQEIRQYLLRSQGATHSIRFNVQDIFRVRRNGEQQRFDAFSFSNLIYTGNSDRRLLWHGSRCTNFGGILSQGLRIAPPEAPVNGYAFGKGVYLADISSKSANYCHPEDSGNTGLILLCEAELGHPKLELLGGFEHDDYPGLAKSKSCVSTLGKGQTSPVGWKDASCVHSSLAGVKMPDVGADLAVREDKSYRLIYNEYIVYDIAQVQLRYLLRVSMAQSRG